MEHFEFIHGLISADLQSAKRYAEQALKATSAPIFLKNADVSVKNYKSAMNIIDKQGEFKVLVYQDFRDVLQSVVEVLKDLLVRLKKFEQEETGLKFALKFSRLSASISSLVVKQVDVDKSNRNLASKIKFYTGKSLTTPRLIAEAYFAICKRHRAEPLDSVTFSRLVQSQIGDPSEAGIYRIGGFSVKLHNRLEIHADHELLFHSSLSSDIRTIDTSINKSLEKPRVDKKYAEIAARMRNKKPIRMIAEG